MGCAVHAGWGARTGTVQYLQLIRFKCGGALPEQKPGCRCWLSVLICVCCVVGGSVMQLSRCMPFHPHICARGGHSIGLHVAVCCRCCMLRSLLPQPSGACRRMQLAVGAAHRTRQRARGAARLLCRGVHPASNRASTCDLLNEDDVSVQATVYPEHARSPSPSLR